MAATPERKPNLKGMELAPKRTITRSPERDAAIRRAAAAEAGRRARAMLEIAARRARGPSAASGAPEDPHAVLERLWNVMRDTDERLHRAVLGAMAKGAVVHTMLRLIYCNYKAECRALVEFFNGDEASIALVDASCARREGHRVLPAKPDMDYLHKMDGSRDDIARLRIVAWDCRRGVDRVGLLARRALDMVPQSDAARHMQQTFWHAQQEMDNELRRSLLSD